ncbi:MAG: NTP transferase domain-containing protein [Velocimicrobium sp.]
MEKKIGLILLAAGNSIRYEGIKLLDTIEGKQMYLHILDAVRTLSIEPKIMVTQYDEIAKKAKKDGFRVIINVHPEMGISRSIQLGLKEALMLEPSLDAVMFSVCDQPHIKTQTMEAVIEAWKTEEKSIVCVTDGNQLGNPCVFAKKYFEKLNELVGDIGGKSIVKKNMEDVFLLQVYNPEELIDIDTRKNNKNIFYT